MLRKSEAWWDNATQTAVDAAVLRRTWPRRAWARVCYLVWRAHPAVRRDGIWGS